MDYKEIKVLDNIFEIINQRIWWNGTRVKSIEDEREEIRKKSNFSEADLDCCTRIIIEIMEKITEDKTIIEEIKRKYPKYSENEKTS